MEMNIYGFIFWLKKIKTFQKIKYFPERKPNATAPHSFSQLFVATKMLGRSQNATSVSNFSSAHKNNDSSFQLHSIHDQQKCPYKYMKRYLYLLKTAITIFKYLFSLYFLSATIMSRKMVHLSFACNLTLFLTL